MNLQGELNNADFQIIQEWAIAGSNPIAASWMVWMTV